MSITDERRRELIAQLEGHADPATTRMTKTIMPADARGILAMLTELPWRVHDSAGIAAAFKSKLLAGDYNDHMGMGLTITGPDDDSLSHEEKTGIPAPDYDPNDVAFSDETVAAIVKRANRDALTPEQPTKESDMTPTITFKPYEPPKPTLDDAQERRPHVVHRDGIDKLRVMCRVGPSAHELDDRGEPLPLATDLGDEPSEWYLFDADPPEPKTLADVPPGVWCVALDQVHEPCIAWRDSNDYVYHPSEGWDKGGPVYDSPSEIVITRVLGYPQITT